MEIQVRLTIFYSLLILTLKRQIGVGIDGKKGVTRRIGIWGFRKRADGYVIDMCIQWVGVYIQWVKQQLSLLKEKTLYT